MEKDYNLTHCISDQQSFAFYQFSCAIDQQICAFESNINITASLIATYKLDALVQCELTTKTNFPPWIRTLLNNDTVAGMSGTQWRHEKDVTAENEDLLDAMND